MTRICTNEEIKEMVQKIQVYAKEMNLKPTDRSYKYMEILPLYKAGWSQKDLKVVGRELFNVAYEGITLRKYLTKCNIPRNSAGKYVKRKNIEMSLNGKSKVFPDMQTCVQYLKPSCQNMCEESIRKSIEKVLSPEYPQHTFKGFHFKELGEEDVRPELKDTWTRIHAAIVA